MSFLRALTPWKAAAVAAATLGALLTLAGVSYRQGRVDAHNKCVAEAAEVKAEFDAKVADAAAAAYADGVAAARLNAENEKTEERIGDVADSEIGADDLCLSDDVVGRLRALQ